MADQNPSFLVVGHLSKPHGTKGEFFVWPLTDRSEKMFVAGERLLVSDRSGVLPDDRFPPLVIDGVRPFQKGQLLKFLGVESRNQADLLRDRYLLVPFSEVEPLEEGEVFYHQLLGMSVVTAAGVELGEVSEVYDIEPADLLEVRGEERSFLIPFTEEIIVSVSQAERRVVIDPPAGLLDI